MLIFINYVHEFYTGTPILAQPRLFSQYISDISRKYLMSADALGVQHLHTQDQSFGVWIELTQGCLHMGEIRESREN